MTCLLTIHLLHMIAMTIIATGPGLPEIIVSGISPVSVVPDTHSNNVTSTSLSSTTPAFQYECRQSAENAYYVWVLGFFMLKPFVEFVAFTYYHVAICLRHLRIKSMLQSNTPIPITKYSMAILYALVTQVSKNKKRITNN